MKNIYIYYTKRKPIQAKIPLTHNAVIDKTIDVYPFNEPNNLFKQYK